jgi:hypothetical protein
MQVTAFGSGFRRKQGWTFPARICAANLGFVVECKTRLETTGVWIYYL